MKTGVRVGEQLAVPGAVLGFVACRTFDRVDAHRAWLRGAPDGGGLLAQELGLEGAGLLCRALPPGEAAPDLYQLVAELRGAVPGAAGCPLGQVGPGAPGVDVNP